MCGGVCAFCDIVANRADAEIVFADDRNLGFLDIRPLFPGHCLLIPRRHFPTLADLPPDEIAPLFATTQRLSRAVPRALGAAGTFVAMNNVVSQSVPHLHIHVVPRNPKDGLKGFFWPRRGYRDEAHLHETAAAIRTALVEEDGSG